MLEMRDVIEEGTSKILTISCNDPDRKSKAIVIVQEIVAKAIGIRNNPTSGKSQPSQSMIKAVEIYKSLERAQWVAACEEITKDQLMFVDMMSPWYSAIMKGFTPLQAKILECVLQHYHKGIFAKEVARLCLLQTNTTTSTLSRLVKADILQTSKDPKDARRTIYHVADINWLRVHALKWNGSFRKWLEDEPETTPKEDIVDRFITWFMETQICLSKK